MTHRDAFEKNTKGIKVISGHFEQRIKMIVEALMTERNELKEELMDLRTKNVEWEKKWTKADTTIKVLREQLRGAQHVSVQTEMFAKGVLDIAQKLVHDDKPDDIEKESETRALFTTHTIPSCSVKEAAPKSVENENGVAENSGNNDIENAIGGNGGLQRSLVTPPNLVIASPNPVIEMDVVEEVVGSDHDKSDDETKMDKQPDDLSAVITIN